MDLSTGPTSKPSEKASRVSGKGLGFLQDGEPGPSSPRDARCPPEQGKRLERRPVAKEESLEQPIPQLFGEAVM